MREGRCLKADRLTEKSASSQGSCVRCRSYTTNFHLSFSHKLALILMLMQYSIVVSLLICHLSTRCGWWVKERAWQKRDTGVSFQGAQAGSTLSLWVTPVCVLMHLLRLSMPEQPLHSGVVCAGDKKYCQKYR